MKRLLLALLAITFLPAHALELQPKAEYRARRAALADKLHGGVAILFAADEAQLDLMPYRQDEDFFYLTGWTEPGAALIILAPTMAAPSPMAGVPAREAQPYREILLLPTRNRRLELYTGVKLDAATPNAASIAGFDEVAALTELPAILNAAAANNRGRMQALYGELDAAHTLAVTAFTAATLGIGQAPALRDVHPFINTLRAIKSPAEIELLRKASDASIAGHLAGMRAIRPGVRERTVAGAEIAAFMAAGCERPSYAPIVGAGVNSTTLHYSSNDAIMHSGDIVVIDEACEYSMYASDITRTMPVNGHFTPRQLEIYNIVLGAQRAAIDAFVAGKSRIGGASMRGPDVNDSLDKVAFDYINTHGKDLHGAPLGKYFIHGVGHSVGINVHDGLASGDALLPGMVFTIEPGIYIPEEKLGVRIEDTFYVAADGKLVNLGASLPHEAADIEAAMSH